MKKLELKIPPVLVFLLAWGAMYQVARWLPQFSVDLPFRFLVFAVCFGLSGWFGLAGLYQFKKARTTIHPQQVHKATTLVQEGVYAYSRNPMYFGLLLLLIAYGYMQQNLASLVVCLLFVCYMNRFQIKPEERHLVQRFGEQYQQYKQRVRRWI